VKSRQEDGSSCGLFVIRNIEPFLHGLDEDADTNSPHIPIFGATPAYLRHWFLDQLIQVLPNSADFQSESNSFCKRHLFDTSQANINIEQWTTEVSSPMNLSDLGFLEMIDYFELRMRLIPPNPLLPLTKSSPLRSDVSRIAESSYVALELGLLSSPSRNLSKPHIEDEDSPFVQIKASPPKNHEAGLPAPLGVNLK